MPQKQQIVLVCPLDWGLGHASRMIPVIDRFIACDYQVMLGGSGKSGELLKATFPLLQFITIPSPEIRYSVKSRWLLPSLMLQLPRLLFAMVHEHHLIKKVVALHKVDLIVSDNRYGLFCKSARCIFITHQISPVLPAWLCWAEYPLYLILRNMIVRFNECWIPDFADPLHNLSGRLSHRFRLPRNARYIGVLSRFDPKYGRSISTSGEKYELVLVLSGPEPMSGIFFDILIRQVLELPYKTLILSGLRDNTFSSSEKNLSKLTIVSHLEPGQFGHVLMNADLIVCRSGYSGIMDLVALGKTAVLVPTPGQPEQQYLAAYLSEKDWFTGILQHKLDLRSLMENQKKGISPSNRYPVAGNEELPIAPLSHEKYR